MAIRAEKILVLGAGNDLLMDEGIGVHVIRAMAERELPENVALVNGGVSGIDLLEDIMNTGRLIIVDAMEAGEEPGAVFRFRAGEVEVLLEEHKTSLHQVDLFDTLKMARFLGRCPETVIIGIQPAKIAWGMELSPVLANQISRIIEIIYSEINTFTSRT